MSRSNLRFAALFVLVIASLLALSASTALAAPLPHELGATFASPGSGPGQLTDPSGIAVEEATHDVYVVDRGNDRVERFSSAGAFLGLFDGSGANPGEGSAAPSGRFSGPEAIAIDNDPTSPSYQDVYVTDVGHSVIDKFGPSGEFIGQITIGAEGKTFAEIGTLAGLAVDTSGGLWVYFNAPGEAPIEQFSGAVANAYLSTFKAQIQGHPEPGFVKSPAGFYVIYRERFTVARLNALGEVENEEVGGIEEGAAGLAVEPPSEDVYVSHASRIDRFGPGDALVESFSDPAVPSPGALAVDSSTGAIYTVDPTKGLVAVFVPREPGPPRLGPISFTKVTADAAALEAAVDPHVEAGLTPITYRFEYGPCPSLAACPTALFPLATASATLPPGFGFQPVADGLSGLLPATIYHIRLRARNELGESLGAETTFTTQPAGGSVLLPDSRQWQLVSPPDKQGALIEPIEERGVVQAAADGRAITYLANGPTEPQPAGVEEHMQILSTRAPGGWLSQDLDTSRDTFSGPLSNPEYRGFSDDLAFAFADPTGGFTAGVSPESSERTAYRRTDYLNGDPAQQCVARTMSCYRPLVTGKEGFANVGAGVKFGEEEIKKCPQSDPCGPDFIDGTPDGAHAVAESSVALTETPIAGTALYEWDAAAPPARQLQLLSRSPGTGEPIHEPYLGSGNRNMRGAISTDGSRVIFSEGFNPARSLFLRDTSVGETGETVQLDAGDVCGTCESGGGKFQLASADGSRVFFTDQTALTADSGAGKTGPDGSLTSDLYECHIEVDGEGHLACELTDLTPKTPSGESAGVLGTVIGASKDGSSLYFVANGVLSEGLDPRGEQARSGGCGNGETPVPGAAAVTCNLYRLLDGRPRLVTVLSGLDAHNWAGLGQLPARVSPDGRWLALMSQRSLTGYDNRDLATDEPAAEVYLYAAAADRVLCASCDPTGARPHGIEYRRLENEGIVGGPLAIWPGTALVAANVPGWTTNEFGATARHQPRYLSDSGRLFFNTPNPLVPADSNGTQDVYQYEPPGVGSCTEGDPTFSALNGGCVDLITSGSSKQESAFMDASESGDDVFFLTSGRLDPARDVDAAPDVYDAHVCTAAVPCLPEPPVPAPACAGDACQLPAVPPNDQTPGSLTFQGAGNLLECPKGKVKRSGKCVKKQSKKHHVRHERNKGKHKHRAKKHQRKGTVNP